MGRRHHTACLWLVVLCTILSPGAVWAAYDMVVAQDGTGNYTTVQDAIMAAPDYHPGRTTIFVKAGTYVEKVRVPKSKPRITLIGEDRGTTIITNDAHATVNPDESVTGAPDSTTFYIRGKQFAAKNITFANSAGNVGPAIAAWVRGDKVRFHNCAFLGYQDTLCTFAKQVYFNHCYIEGAIDFIFGDSTAVFQRCTLHCIGNGYITAADTDEGQPFGYVFNNCDIYGDAPAGSMLLGRAWGAYAKVAFIHCRMDGEIAPEGWWNWNADDPAATTYFAEYHTSGTGADPADRVDWSHQLTSDEVSDYTVENIFHVSSIADTTPMLVVAPTHWYEIY